MIRNAQFVHGVHQYLHMFGINMLVYPMSEVENMTRTATEGTQDRRDFLADTLRSSVQYTGIHISLQGHSVADPLPRRTDIDGPIHA